MKKERDVFSATVQIRVGRQHVVLAQPLTYMNLSGVAVKALARKHHISLSDVLIVCDDLDLELGRMKIREDGSAGGHRGLTSIFQMLGTTGVLRLKLGIEAQGDGLDCVECHLIESVLFDAIGGGVRDFLPGVAILVQQLPGLRDAAAAAAAGDSRVRAGRDNEGAL